MQRNFNLFVAPARLEVKPKNIRVRLRHKDEYLYLYMGLLEELIIYRIFEKMYVTGEEIRFGDVIRFGTSKPWLVTERSISMTKSTRVTIQEIEDSELLINSLEVKLEELKELLLVESRWCKDYNNLDRDLWVKGSMRLYKKEAFSMETGRPWNSPLFPPLVVVEVNPADGGGGAPKAPEPISIKIASKNGPF